MYFHNKKVRERMKVVLGLRSNVIRSYTADIPNLQKVNESHLPPSYRYQTSSIMGDPRYRALQTNVRSDSHMTIYSATTSPFMALVTSAIPFAAPPIVRGGRLGTLTPSAAPSILFPGSPIRGPPCSG